MVALYKCGHQPGDAPNDWYGLQLNFDTRDGQDAIAGFQRKEMDFYVVKVFKSEDEAIAFMRENGMRFPWE